MARNIYPVSAPLRKTSSIDEPNRPRTDLERWNTRQKQGTPPRDTDLQGKVLSWMMNVLQEKPKGFSDYDQWIRDGTVLVKIMTHMVFNSVPMDMIMPQKGLNSKEERVNILIKYFHKLGVPPKYIFDQDDLCELKNVPKVTRCMAMLAKVCGIKDFEGIDVDATEYNSGGTNGQANGHSQPA